MQNIKIKFAYKRGFRRAWAVLSLIWLIAVVMIKVGDYDPVYWIFMAGILPPIIIYAVGAALVWVVEGFARADQ